MARIGCGQIATVGGRYYGMDRDNRWDRVQLAYRALTLGEGETASSAAEAVTQSYAKGETDEFIRPTVVIKDGAPVATVGDGDSVIFFNFRPDRARELTRAFCCDDFDGFDRGPRKQVTYVCFTDYDVTIPNKAVAFDKVTFVNTLGEWLAANGLKQARIAETEKYAHVTFFFNGGVEAVDGQLFICADHGNAEAMVDAATGEPLTSHTTNPVPFILVNYDPAYTLREGGCLADVAPTLLEMMGLEKPEEMTDFPLKGRKS